MNSKAFRIPNDDSPILKHFLENSVFFDPILKKDLLKILKEKAKRDKEASTESIGQGAQVCAPRALQAVSQASYQGLINGQGQGAQPKALPMAHGSPVDQRAQAQSPTAPRAHAPQSLISGQALEASVAQGAQPQALPMDHGALVGHLQGLINRKSQKPSLISGQALEASRAQGAQLKSVLTDPRSWHPDLSANVIRMIRQLAQRYDLQGAPRALRGY